MYFSPIICNESLYQDAKGFFLQQGRSDLLTREPSSLVGAYIVTQQMFKFGKVGFSFMEGIFSYEGLYFSTAHCEDLLVVAIDYKKVAVDVEYIKPRDASLLQNIHIPDSSFSLRENFYLQRCAKECLVKYLDLTSSEMNNMTISSFMPNHYFLVDGWEFNSLIIVQYRGKENPVHINIKNGTVTALLYQDNY